MGALDQPTLVLNRSWMPVHVTSARRALGLLFRGHASAVRPDTYEVFDFSAWSRQPPREPWRCVRTVVEVIPLPEIVLLRAYDRPVRRSVPFNRRNLLRRDALRCQYCGRRPGIKHLTTDHVIPRRLGGTTHWGNCVLACVTCNGRKGGRTPEQAGMRLLSRPREPDWDTAFRGGVPSLDDFLQNILSERGLP